jgi:1,4-dihydroxy-2-naphthoate octaprenyltransferase
MKAKVIPTNRLAYFIIACLIIVIAFLLLGGGPWIKGLAYAHGSTDLANLHWGQILIGTVVGFLTGLIVSRKK